MKIGELFDRQKQEAEQRLIERLRLALIESGWTPKDAARRAAIDVKAGTFTENSFPPE